MAHQGGDGGESPVKGHGEDHPVAGGAGDLGQCVLPTQLAHPGEAGGHQFSGVAPLHQLLLQLAHVLLQVLLLALYPPQPVAEAEGYVEADKGGVCR